MNQSNANKLMYSEKFQSRKFLLGTAIIGITMLGIGSKRVNIEEGSKIIISTFGKNYYV